jgi:Flp pilus assembly protein TadG
MALRRLMRDQRGGVAILVGLVAVPMALATGVAVDASRLYLVRARLAEAVDAAALAAVQAADDTSRESDAERMFRANFPQDYMDASAGSPNVTYDGTTGRVTVTASADVPTTLMRLARVESVTVGARASAERRTKPLELALVLDTTGAMKPNLTALKKAAQDLVFLLLGPHAETDNVSIALIPFNARVDIGASRSDWLASSAPANWNGCVEARAGLHGLDDAPPADGRWEPTPKKYSYTDGNQQREAETPCPPIPIQALSEKKADALHGISALTVNGTRRLDMGARWGWRTLSPQWRGLWGGFSLPRNLDDDVIKAMVMVTGGGNEVNTDYDEVASNAVADENFRSVCSAMRNEGYVIYMIGFQTPVTTRTLLQECAGSATHYFESPTQEHLVQAFHQIAARLTVLRVVRVE